MLKEMSVLEWREWQVYMSLAPFSEERADIRAAQVCQTIVNMNRDTKEHPQPIPLKEFILKFGDATESVKKVEKTQTVEEMERHISDWVAGANQIFAESKRYGM